MNRKVCLQDSDDESYYSSESSEDYLVYVDAKNKREPGDISSDKDKSKLFLSPISMEVDTNEHLWARLRDISVTGDVLEYKGRGEQIQDNGYAQANFPLSPMNHYFEIKILDPGESCYIAIGIAKKDYPIEKHPGWHVGSFAFHADDGKLFTGQELGTVFGPKCGKGDVLGLGIVFPPHFTDISLDEQRKQWAWETPENVRRSREKRDRSPYYRGARQPGHHPYEQMLEVFNINGDSDDEVSWLNENELSEGKVTLFIRRNSKLLGIRQVRIPRGGYFPTIGLLSKGERVRVDFNPLSG